MIAKIFSPYMDFGIKRTGWQAVFFYIMWLIALFFVGFAFSTFLGNLGRSSATDFESGFAEGQMQGAFVGPLVCMTVSWLVLRAKGLLKEKKYIFFIILSGILGLLALVGLMVPAYLTTKEARSE